MVWKCPKCSMKSRSYQAMQRHYYSKHYKRKSSAKPASKGKDKRAYTFKPTLKKR